MSHEHPRPCLDSGWQQTCGGNDAQFDRNCFSSPSSVLRPSTSMGKLGGGRRRRNVARRREVCHRCDQRESEGRPGGRKAIETITAKEKYRRERERGEGDHHHLFFYCFWSASNRLPPPPPLPRESQGPRARRERALPLCSYFSVRVSPLFVKIRGSICRRSRQPPTRGFLPKGTEVNQKVCKP